jgi:hypothetical protein
MDSKLCSSVADPGSGAFLTPDSGSGMGKNQDPDRGSRSGMNNPDHVSESLETIFGLKYLYSLMRIRDPGWKKFGSGIEQIRIREGKNSDPRSGMEKFGSVPFGSGIRDKYPGSATLLCRMLEYCTRVFCAGTGSMCGPTRASCCQCPAC